MTVIKPKQMKSYHSSALPMTAAATWRGLGVRGRADMPAIVIMPPGIAADNLSIVFPARYRVRIRTRIIHTDEQLRLQPYRRSNLMAPTFGPRECPVFPR